MCLIYYANLPINCVKICNSGRILLPESSVAATSVIDVLGWMTIGFALRKTHQ